ncbi:MAG: sugar ABC transporter permease [Clostridia bacterium]|nr:sugar ABC transporter permease [Clostridia bacterium]
MTMNPSIKKKTTPREKKRRIFIVSMLALPVLQWLVFFAYVNINSVLMSFQSISYSTGKITWTLKNYTRFFNELTQLPYIRGALKNSFIAGLNNLLLVLISLILAYFFYKKIPGRSIFRVVYFLPSIISIVVYTMVFKFIFDTSIGPINIVLQKLGVEATNLPAWFGDTHLAFPLIMLYCLWVGTGYNIIILGAAMENLPESVMEYSKLEGVGKFRELFQIVIPMIWPTLSVAFLGCITVMFSLFIQVSLLTGGGPGNSTYTVAYMVNSLVSGYSSDLEWGATMGLCFTVIAAPMVIILKKILDKVGEHFGC